MQRYAVLPLPSTMCEDLRLNVMAYCVPSIFFSFVYSTGWVNINDTNITCPKTDDINWSVPLSLTNLPAIISLMGNSTVEYLVDIFGYVRIYGCKINVWQL